MGAMEPEALGRWFEAQAVRLELYARQWLEPAEAADAVQEAFCRLAGQGQAPRDVPAWLFATVRNAAISQVRSAGRRRRRERAAAGRRAELFIEDPASPIDAARAGELLERLPAEQKEVVVLRIWGQLSFRQIVEVVGRPLTSVRREYLAGLEAMRERMTSRERTTTPCPKMTD